LLLSPIAILLVCVVVTGVCFCVAGLLGCAHADHGDEGTPAQGVCTQVTAGLPLLLSEWLVSRSHTGTAIAQLDSQFRDAGVDMKAQVRTTGARGQGAAGEAVAVPGAKDTPRAPDPALRGGLSGLVGAHQAVLAKCDCMQAAHEVRRSCANAVLRVPAGAEAAAGCTTAGVCSSIREQWRAHCDDGARGVEAVYAV